MLEVEFEVADLARVRFAISPMDHLLGGVASPEHHCGRASLRRQSWWNQVKNNVPHQALPFIKLVNASAVGVPDFLGPHTAQGRVSLTDELDALLSTSQSQIHEELEFYGTGPGTPRIISELREGGTRQIRQIANAAWALSRACLMPDWADIQRALHADIADRAHAIAAAGVGAMLTELHPDLEWNHEGTLRLGGPGWDGSFRLAGRGLQLRPSLFLHVPTALLSNNRPAVLMYPTGSHATPRPAGLAGLVGPAKTRALEAIARGACTTTELAKRLGVTAPTASAHATALRNAGAIVTQRHGRQVRHALTPLGSSLVRT